MKTQVAEFENVYTPVRDTLFDAGLAFSPNGKYAEMVMRDVDADRGTFDVVFETVRPGLFLRVEGRVPLKTRETVYQGYCELTFATAKHDCKLFDDWQKIRSARVNGHLSGPYSVNIPSMSTADYDTINLTKILLDIAVEMLPYFEGMKVRAERS